MTGPSLNAVDWANAFNGFIESMQAIANGIYCCFKYILLPYLINKYESDVNLIIESP
jgi:hypothetical protein